MVTHEPPASVCHASYMSALTRLLQDGFLSNFTVDPQLGASVSYA